MSWQPYVLIVAGLALLYGVSQPFVVPALVRDHWGAMFGLMACIALGIAALVVGGAMAVFGVISR